MFIVYVAGADEPQQITLPPGSTKTLLFKNVADFGNMAQAVVAMWGKYRWFTPGVDVLGHDCESRRYLESLVMASICLARFVRCGEEMDRASSYRSGLCTLNTASVTPTPGEYEYFPFRRKEPDGHLCVGLGTHCGDRESVALF